MRMRRRSPAVCAAPNTPRTTGRGAARYASAPTQRPQCDEAQKTTHGSRDTAQRPRLPRTHGLLTRARPQGAPAPPAGRPPAAVRGVMTPPASSWRLGSEFDDFLFAPLGEDGNGLPVRIVSLLGRMGLDPWQEAATLAALPTEAGVYRLASLLAAQPVRFLTQAEPATAAARLIALLPRRTAPTASSPVRFASVSAATLPRVVMTAILLAIYLVLFFASPFGSNLRDPSARTDAARAPAPLILPAHTPPGTE